MMPDNRFNQSPLIPQQQQAPIGLPRMTPIPNMMQGQAPSQVIATGTNPFTKHMQQFQQGQKQFNPLIPGSQVNNNMFTRQNNNMPFTNANNNKNPFIPNNQVINRHYNFSFKTIKTHFNQGICSELLHQHKLDLDWSNRLVLEMLLKLRHRLLDLLSTH